MHECLRAKWQAAAAILQPADAHLEDAALPLVCLDQRAVLHVPDVQRLVEGAAGQVPAKQKGRQPEVLLTTCKYMKTAVRLEAALGAAGKRDLRMRPVTHAC